MTSVEHGNTKYNVKALLQSKISLEKQNNRQTLGYVDKKNV